LLPTSEKLAKNIDFSGPNALWLIREQDFHSLVFVNNEQLSDVCGGVSPLLPVHSAVLYLCHGSPPSPGSDDGMKLATKVTLHQREGGGIVLSVEAGG
jgi:hypothetical protein